LKCAALWGLEIKISKAAASPFGHKVCGINHVGLLSPSRPGWDAMRIFAASTLTLFLLTSVAFSQQSIGAGENVNTWTAKQDADSARAAMEQKKKQQELDAQYKAALGRAKTTAPSDPWGDVRSVKAPAH
jgi:hypothetical protein